MEDTLREDVKNFFGMNRDVLILVLMEDTLRDTVQCRFPAT